MTSLRSSANDYVPGNASLESESHAQLRLPLGIRRLDLAEVRRQRIGDDRRVDVGQQVCPVQDVEDVETQLQLFAPPDRQLLARAQCEVEVFVAVDLRRRNRGEPIERPP